MRRLGHHVLDVPEVGLVLHAPDDVGVGVDDLEHRGGDQLGVRNGCGESPVSPGGKRALRSSVEDVDEEGVGESSTEAILDFLVLDSWCRSRESVITSQTLTDAFSNFNFLSFFLTF